MMEFVAHTLTLAHRDIAKFRRDRGRQVAALIFPAIFLGVFGVTLNAGLGQAHIGFNYIEYVFSGILIQTIFQSSFLGIVSLISDREKDFAMSIFVAPVSRFAIVFGKILGESIVSLLQLFGIIALGLLLGVHFAWARLLFIFPMAALASLVGASFGVLVASRIDDEETARRLFPFLVFPMIFLSGAFTPVRDLPLILTILKSINPLYYGVDLMRHILYIGRPELPLVVAQTWWWDAGVFTGLGVIFFLVGTWLFTQKEGNK
jgi:ABC-2 type transport system permease protein